MQYTASGIAASESDQTVVSIPGLVAAAAWAVGLIVGLVALAIGHVALAGVSLVLAIMAPWIGLAWVSHNQRRVATAGPIPVRGWPGLHFTAR